MMDQESDHQDKEEVEQKSVSSAIMADADATNPGGKSLPFATSTGNDNVTNGTVEESKDEFKIDYNAPFDPTFCEDTESEKMSCQQQETKEEDGILSHEAILKRHLLIDGSIPRPCGYCIQGHNCKGPTLELCTAHRCSSCKGILHMICVDKNEDEDLLLCDHCSKPNASTNTTIPVHESVAEEQKSVSSASMTDVPDKNLPMQQAKGKSIPGGKLNKKKKKKLIEKASEMTLFPKMKIKGFDGIQASENTSPEPSDDEMDNQEITTENATETKKKKSLRIKFKSPPIRLLPHRAAKQQTSTSPSFKNKK